MANYRLQIMQPEQWNEVAALIHDSTNGWYQKNRNHLIFNHGPRSTLLFCEEYEALDPGHCLLACDQGSGRILGSCFFHPRETHFSLGIMNVHPDAFGRGVARCLLTEILQRADRERKPVRLVSSAMNLDSWSLYTRAGFVPRQMYQDMILAVPASGLAEEPVSAVPIRAARVDDLDAMGELELQVSGIRRSKDYRHFVENPAGHWHASVACQGDTLLGWIASIVHPGSAMVGPCIAANQQVAGDLLLHELNVRSGNEMVFLIPVDCDQLIRRAYGWGARICELHVAQVRGAFRAFDGVSMPTFMPETG